MLSSKEKQEILTRTGKLLNLAGVFLTDSKAHLCDEIRIGEHIDGQRQTFNQLTLVSVDKRGDEEEVDYEVRYRVRYGLGIRYVSKELEEKDDNYVLVEITAELEAHYFSDEEISETDIKVFSGLNVPYNMWPYWREYVQNTCARMGLPPLTVPFQTSIQDIEI